MLRTSTAHCVNIPHKLNPMLSTLFATSDGDRKFTLRSLECELYFEL